MKWTGAGNWRPYRPPSKPKPAAKPKPAPPKPKYDVDEQPRRFDSALVVGRFDPPHTGHRHLVSTAQGRARRVTILVVVREDDVLPWAARTRWLRETHPDAQVLKLELQDESPDAIAKAIRRRPDVVFSSEAEGALLADRLRCEHRYVDPDRIAVPISGTAIRRAPMTYFDRLLPATRPWVVRRVCLLGHGGAGKSTLAERLARRLDTEWVPEHARIWSAHVGPPTLETVTEIASQHLASEDAATLSANRVLLSDAGSPAIVAWSNERFGVAPKWLAQDAATRYDLRLILGTPPDDELDDLHRELRNHVLVAEDLDARVEEAVAAIEALLTEDAPLLSRWGRRDLGLD